VSCRRHGQEIEYVLDLAPRYLWLSAPEHRARGSVFAVESVHDGQSSPAGMSSRSRRHRSGLGERGSGTPAGHAGRRRGRVCMPPVPVADVQDNGLVERSRSPSNAAGGHIGSGPQAGVPSMRSGDVESAGTQAGLRRPRGGPGEHHGAWSSRRASFRCQKRRYGWEHAMTNEQRHQSAYSASLQSRWALTGGCG